jgi:iron(III) transport system ATP-binding protein
MEPELLLLDEPLSNLDAKLRQAMRFELKRMQRELGLTTIYVTHDQSEALALSHEIAVMKDGRVVQIGSPRDIYERPRNRFVADFVGNTNFIDGTLLAAGGGNARCVVATPLGEFHVQCVEPLAKGAAVAVSVRPEDVELSEAEPAREEDDNVCRGTVAAKVFLGDYLDFQVKVGDSVLLARVHPSLRTPAGDAIYLRMRAEKCIAIAEASAPRQAA